MDPHTILGEGHGGEPIALTRDERMMHCAILGSSGTGKSSLLLTIAMQDVVRNGGTDGLMFIDPHGDAAQALIDRIPKHRHNHVCYLELGNPEWPIALNPLSCEHPDDRAFVADAFVSALRDIWFADSTAAPRLENILRHSALALLDVPGSTIAHIPRLLTDDDFRHRVVPRVRNAVTRRFLIDRYEEWTAAFKAEATESLLTRIDAVLSFPVILNTLGQHKATLDIAKAMNSGRLIIANLANVGTTGAHLMGALLIAGVRAAAMARARLRPEERRDFHMIIDEAQTMSTASLPAMLAQLRKFNVSALLATQMLDALSDQTRSALLGVIGTIAAFRVGIEDAPHLARSFDRLHQRFNDAALHELERGQAMVKIAAGDVKHVHTLIPSAGLGSREVVIRQSRRHYGRPRAEVERWIAKEIGRRDDRAEDPRARASFEDRQKTARFLGG